MTSRRPPASTRSSPPFAPGPFGTAKLAVPDSRFRTGPSPNRITIPRALVEAWKLLLAAAPEAKSSRRLSLRPLRRWPSGARRFGHALQPANYRRLPRRATRPGSAQLSDKMLGLIRDLDEVDRHAPRMAAGRLAGRRAVVGRDAGGKGFVRAQRPRTADHVDALRQHHRLRQPASGTACSAISIIIAGRSG